MNRLLRQRRIQTRIQTRPLRPPLAYAAKEAAPSLPRKKAWKGLCFSRRRLSFPACTLRPEEAAQRHVGFLPKTRQKSELCYPAATPCKFPSTQFVNRQLRRGGQRPRLSRDGEENARKKQSSLFLLATLRSLPLQLPSPPFLLPALLCLVARENFLPSMKRLSQRAALLLRLVAQTPSDAPLNCRLPQPTNPQPPPSPMRFRPLLLEAVSLALLSPEAMLLTGVSFAPARVSVRLVG